MAKSDIQTQSEPAPQMAKTVVSVKVTVPLVQYGNIEMFVSQEIFTEVSDSQEYRDGLIRANLNRLQSHLVQQIVPMVEAEVPRAKLNPDFLKAQNPDAWMQRNNPAYRWLRVAAPDMKISAMETIMHGEQLPT